METGQDITNLPTYGVFELSTAVKHKVETGFQHIRVKGELGRVTRARSGHVYLDMKDDKAVLSCVIWRGAAAGLRFRPEEGMEVVAQGRLTTYPGRSQYQMVIESLELAGVGALMKLLEDRKQKLTKEGLFDSERKKDLPFLPETIGVITSPTGAVIRDILHRLEDRFPRHVLLWPILVQGETAAQEAVRALEGFHALGAKDAPPRPDLVMIARGGGSLEDLWPFNDESLVRAVAKSTIPVISAIGHETDWTLLDLVADHRAPTPTAAAEMATPVRRDLMGRLEELKARLGTALLRSTKHKNLQIKAARLPRPDDLLAIAHQSFDRVCERLDRALLQHIQTQGMRLKGVASRLVPSIMERAWHRRAQTLGQVQSRFERAMHHNLEKRFAYLQARGVLLEALSHKKILERGFVLVKRHNNVLARHAADMKIGDPLRLVFHDGEKPAVITNGAGRTKASKPPPQKSVGQGSLFS